MLITVCLLVCVCVCSLLLQQSPDLLQRATRCAGFLHTAVLCYIRLLQLFLEGHTPTQTTEPPEQQVTVCYLPDQYNTRTCNTVLKSLTHFVLSGGAVPDSQRRQAVCSDSDLTDASHSSVLQSAQTGDTHKHLSTLTLHFNIFCLDLITSSCLVSLLGNLLVQLESQCADVDPEVTAALSVHLSPHSLSPEMDFF